MQMKSSSFFKNPIQNQSGQPKRIEHICLHPNCNKRLLKLDTQCSHHDNIYVLKINDFQAKFCAVMKSSFGKSQQLKDQDLQQIYKDLQPFSRIKGKKFPIYLSNLSRMMENKFSYLIQKLQYCPKKEGFLKSFNELEFVHKNDDDDQDNDVQQQENKKRKRLNISGKNSGGQTIKKVCKGINSKEQQDSQSESEENGDIESHDKEQEEEKQSQEISSIVSSSLPQSLKQIISYTEEEIQDVMEQQAREKQIQQQYEAEEKIMEEEYEQEIDLGDECSGNNRKPGLDLFKNSERNNNNLTSIRFSQSDYRAVNQDNQGKGQQNDNWQSIINVQEHSKIDFSQQFNYMQEAYNSLQQNQQDQNQSNISIRTGRDNQMQRYFQNPSQQSNKNNQVRADINNLFQSQENSSQSSFNIAARNNNQSRNRTDVDNNNDNQFQNIQNISSQSNSRAGENINFGERQQLLLQNQHQYANQQSNNGGGSNANPIIINSSSSNNGQDNGQNSNGQDNGQNSNGQDGNGQNGNGQQDNVNDVDQLYYQYIMESFYDNKQNIFPGQQFFFKKYGDFMNKNGCCEFIDEQLKKMPEYLRNEDALQDEFLFLTSNEQNAKSLASELAKHEDVNTTYTENGHYYCQVICKREIESFRIFDFIKDLQFSIMQIKFDLKLLKTLHNQALKYIPWFQQQQQQ